MRNRDILITIFIILLILTVIFVLNYNKKNINSQISDPAAEYCISSGYDYQIKTNPDGSQYGTCTFFDDSKCNAWDYFCKCENDERYCSTEGLNCSQECK